MSEAVYHAICGQPAQSVNEIGGNSLEIPRWFDKGLRPGAHCPFSHL